MAADLEKQVIGGKLDFVVLLGDEVRWSTASEWSRFGVRHAESLDSTHLPTGEHARVPSLVVAGDRDFVLDGSLARLEDSFPGLGAEIGFNRVASWYTFDLKAGEHTWRFMTLDSNKDAMGSRWNEQDAWIPRAANGDYDHLLMFMHHPRLTLAVGEEMNKDNVPRGLIDAVEQHTGILKLRTVFAGGSHTSEVFLPEGVIGTAYVVAGGGGEVASDLERWGTDPRLATRTSSWSPCSTWPFRISSWSGESDQRCRRKPWIGRVLKASGRGSQRPMTLGSCPCLATGSWNWRMGRFACVGGM